MAINISNVVNLLVPNSASVVVLKVDLLNYMIASDFSELCLDLTQVIIQPLINNTVITLIF